VILWPGINMTRQISDELSEKTVNAYSPGAMISSTRASFKA